ncbi:TPA: excinuclease ABC subunit C [candidate division CPR2 bacterium]|uniref:UvrABC system protein C n=1 Tax=candidate division CPR2 bacterium GW2011_GWC1_41_48 TaxID=1618344 RepID=A0A0G0W7R1_UNCC2|nr:MAG: UvrABC system protein C [candidate division CPR2 bacterium GW2011_GWC2_39_35]KKR29345.1 MAG: UvrABC system protein C [candidate division CPR2 bacterium GW2011_GWD2_39_7]KKS09000.1 MAG: UvrABC system protein C [candidate division CPR2 bacterium GW2011_GWC1_41_48]OGB71168.1 MAG: excinuclease ABC subunit C [candidate division CPR2 bacterium GWD2_39_7]HBG81924.1 excinuclease ABC subunit C [candidate division CPR2 bacterium]
MNNNDLREKANNLPQKPGVYIFKDGKGKVLYVGKAIRLKNRVISYFGKPDLARPQITVMMAQAEALDYVIVSSEVEALITENNFIKRFRPKYNIRMRDDKNYLFIKITKEDFPRVTVVRKPSRDGAAYFGPFTNSLYVRETLNIIKKIFPFRTCKESPLKMRPKPCLQFHIERCLGPCVEAVNKEEYRQMIGEVREFLYGRNSHLLKRFHREMQEASIVQNFEKAAFFRDKIKAVEATLERQNVVNVKVISQDILGAAADSRLAVITLFQVRDGKLIGKENFDLVLSETQPLEEIMMAFLDQYYQDASFIPKEILLPFPLNEDELYFVSELIKEKSGTKVEFKLPKIGRYKELVKMATKNAEEYLSKEAKTFTRETEKVSRGLYELGEALGLTALGRIECYDISNISGMQSVGSMVVFKDGVPAKNEYRKFKIKTLSTPNDFAMMEEVLSRRFRALENNDTNFNKKPDLILIDGGKGQLAVASKVLNSLRINVNMASLAKKEEELISFDANGGFYSIKLPRNSEGLYLLQRVRDEAHRFAISYHKNLRSKYLIKSALNEIPGVGPKTKKLLLEHFGNLDNIKESDEEAIIKVIGESKYKLIKEYL